MVIPPINFIYLAGHLRNHDLKLIDGHLHKLSNNDIIGEVIKFNPNIVCFGGLSSEIGFSLNLAKDVRKVTKAKIIFGGVHTTNLPEEVLNKDYVDFIFRAESEIPFAEFVTKLESGQRYLNVPNLGYKKGQRIFLNKIQLYNFNKIHSPNWDLVDIRGYPKMYINKRHPCAPLFTSRGCPFSCTFCSCHSMNGRKVRIKNLDKVREELQYLKEKFGIREFHIWDENFTLNRKRVIAFCNMLIDNKLNLVWNCPNGLRTDSLDEELLKKMKEAGCWAISLAVEFGTQRMLDVVNKRTSLEKMVEIIPLAERLGIRTTCFFIIGHPAETESDIKETIKLSKKLEISRACFAIYKIIPGSEDYFKYGKDKDRIIFSEGNKKLKKFQRYAILSFYLRPKQFFFAIKDNLTLSQIKELLNIFRSFVIK